MLNLIREQDAKKIAGNEKLNLAHKIFHPDGSVLYDKDELKELLTVIDLNVKAVEVIAKKFNLEMVGIYAWWLSKEGIDPLGNHGFNPSEEEITESLGMEYGEFKDKIRKLHNEKLINADEFIREVEKEDNERNDNAEGLTLKEMAVLCGMLEQDFTAEARQPGAMHPKRVKIGRRWIYPYAEIDRWENKKESMITVDKAVKKFNLDCSIAEDVARKQSVKYILGGSQYVNPDTFVESYEREMDRRKRVAN